MVWGEKRWKVRKEKSIREYAMWCKVLNTFNWSQSSKGEGVTGSEATVEELLITDSTTLMKDIKSQVQQMTHLKQNKYKKIPT